MSPSPLKPCQGAYSSEVQQALFKDTDRARWKEHPCQVCGQIVSAQLYKGKWEPDLHWRSVTYAPAKHRVPGRYARYESQTE